MNQEQKAAIERVKVDIKTIRESRDRTGAMATKPLRWEGVERNPHGYRQMSHLADDLELILKGVK